MTEGRWFGDAYDEHTYREPSALTWWFWKHVWWWTWIAPAFFVPSAIWWIGMPATFAGHCAVVAFDWRREKRGTPKDAPSHRRT